MMTKSNDRSSLSGGSASRIVERARSGTQEITSKSLSGKIFTSILAFTMAVVAAFSLALTTIYYVTYEREAESELALQARDAASVLNEIEAVEVVPTLEQQFSGVVRYTLIARDGTVLYDSAVGDVSTLDNHGSRPEVLAADQKGESAISRYSSTLQTDTVYAAVKLNDGSIVRLSETRESLVAFLGGLVLPMTTLMVVAAAFAFFLSRMMTARIMKPIDALDVSRPLENEIYSEMYPLLQRIDEQQQQLRAQNAELVRAENMRREFSANVSHEMKTPLQVISGYAELMKGGLVDQRDTQRIAELIYDESQSMRVLINDVLTLSRLDESSSDEARFLPVDLLAVSQRVADRLTTLSNERGVSISVTGEPAFVLGAETLVEEMVYNLVENGLRYNHEGGSVRVEVQQGLDEECAAADGSPARLVLLRISDTGPGIPQGEHERIFERFYRMERSRSKETGGTGLGLAIVKHAVMYHNGSIEVQSALGEGTTFFIKLPMA